MVLNRGADVNARGRWHKTTLHNAAETANLAMIEALMHRGADVNVRDFVGVTPMAAAVTIDCMTIVVMKSCSLLCSSITT